MGKSFRCAATECQSDHCGGFGVCTGLRAALFPAVPQAASNAAAAIAKNDLIFENVTIFSIPLHIAPRQREIAFLNNLL